MNTTTNQASGKWIYAYSYNQLMDAIRHHATAIEVKTQAKRELSIRRIIGSSADDCCHEIAHVGRDPFYSPEDRLSLFRDALKREQGKSNRKSVIAKLTLSIQRLDSKVAA